MPTPNRPPHRVLEQMNIMKNASVERLMVIGFAATLSVLLLVASIALNYAVDSAGAVNLIKASIILLMLFLALLFVRMTAALRERSATQMALREVPLLKAGALQDAIFSSANFSSIATDAQGVIQIFNVGAERMLGYAAGDVVDKLTPADISDAQELIRRAAALSAEFDATISPGFEALVFKASRGIEDIYELTYIRKDGSRFPAMMSVTALRSPTGKVIGFLLIGTDNTARKQVEAEQSDA